MPLLNTYRDSYAISRRLSHKCCQLFIADLWFYDNVVLIISIRWDPSLSPFRLSFLYLNALFTCKFTKLNCFFDLLLNHFYFTASALNSGSTSERPEIWTVQGFCQCSLNWGFFRELQWNVQQTLGCYYGEKWKQAGMLWWDNNQTEKTLEASPYWHCGVIAVREPLPGPRYLLSSTRHGPYKFKITENLMT